MSESDPVAASETPLMFPVMLGRGEKAYVPWSIVAPHEKQAGSNHGQTLKRLAERGGLGPCELAAVLEDRPWHRMEDRSAWEVIVHRLTQAGRAVPVGADTEAIIELARAWLQSASEADENDHPADENWSDQAQDALKFARFILAAMGAK